MKRSPVSLKIDEQLYVTAKKLAAEKRMKMYEVVEEAIRQYANKYKERIASVNS